MANTPGPKLTYSVRLDRDAVTALQLWVLQYPGMSVGGLIRSLIADFLAEREGEDYFVDMERRIVATIERTARQRGALDRKIDIAIAETEYLRRFLVLRHLKKIEPSETDASVLQRGDDFFSSWLRKQARGRLEYLLNQIDGEPPQPEEIVGEGAAAHNFTESGDVNE